MTKYRLKIIDSFGTTDAPGESVSVRGMISNIEAAADIDGMARKLLDIPEKERNRVCLVFDPAEKDPNKMRMTMGDRNAVGIMKRAIPDELKGAVAGVTRPRDSKHERALCGGTFQISDFLNMKHFGLEEMFIVSRQRADRGYYRIARGSASEEQVRAFVEELEARKEEIHEQNKRIARDMLKEDIEDRKRKGLPEQPPSYYAGKEFSNKSMTRQWNALHEVYAEAAKRYGMEYELVLFDEQAEEDQINSYEDKGGADIETTASKEIKEGHKTRRKNKSAYNEPGFEILDNSNASNRQRIDALHYNNPRSELLAAVIEKDPDPNVRATAIGHDNLDPDDYKRLVRDRIGQLSDIETKVAFQSKHADSFSKKQIENVLAGEKWKIAAIGLAQNHRVEDFDLVIEMAVDRDMQEHKLDCLLKAIHNKSISDTTFISMVRKLYLTKRMSIDPGLKNEVKKIGELRGVDISAYTG